MNESRIIKSIKFHAIKHLLDGEYWHIDKLFAYAAAIIYPFISQVEFDDQSGSIKQLVKVLTKFLRTQKSNNLDILSFEGMLSFFVDKLCSNVTYATKKECLSKSITLISSISEDGYISWKGKTEVYNSVVKTYEKYAYLYEYGRESYNVISIAENKPNSNKLPLTDKIMNTPKVKKERKQVPIPSKTNEAEEELTKYWEKEIIQKSPDFMKAMPYVWKLALPYSTYCDLKSKLQNCLSNLQGRARTAFVKKHSLKLFIYIAEWYKWEYQSSTINALDEFSVTIQAGEIWSNLDKWQKFRYSGEANDIHLHSIYALGGLPLKYVGNNDTRFCEAFEAVYKKDTIDNILEKFEKALASLSVAFRRSLVEVNGSWRYLIQVMQDNYTSLYATEDQENDFVKKLYELLVEGKRRAVQDKFDIKYYAWKSHNNFYVHRLLEMRECCINEYNEIPADVISHKRIENWGIEPSYVFNLQFKVGAKRLLNHKFVPYQGTNYRSSTWQSRFDLPDLTDEGISPSVDICYIGQNGESKNISSLDFPKQGYIEFRKVGKFEWKDKKSTRTTSDKAAVLFDTEKWKVEDGALLCTFNNFAWAEFAEQITLIGVADAKKVTLYNVSERYWIEPMEESIHPITRLSYVKIDDNRVKLTINEENQDVYLLKHPVKFCKIDMDNALGANGESVAIGEPSDKVEYRLHDSSSFKDYDNRVNALGYITFRITTSNGQNKIIHGYILPDDATISRHCEPTRGNVRYDRCPNNIPDSLDADKKSDYIPINIKEGDYAITINVARPFLSQDLFKDNEIDSMNNTIPIRFADRYQMRIIDENGVKRIAVDDSCREHLMSRLRKAIYNNKKEVKIDKLTYCTYTKDIEYANRVGYYVDSGNSIISTNLTFGFLSLTDSTFTEINLIEKEDIIGNKRTKYLVLDGIPASKDGIVLQSLYDKNGNKQHPLRYYKPYYIASTKESVSAETRMLRKVKRLCKFVASETELLSEITYKHFDVACKCGCYFAAMDRLLALTYMPSCINNKKCDAGVSEACEYRKELTSKQFHLADAERMAKFYIGYCSYCTENGSQVNYPELWRMAEELCCDWLLIPRKIWQQVIDNDKNKKKLVIKLLESRPREFYKILTENYWNLEWKAKKGPKSNNRCAYNFMKYILTADGKRPMEFPDRESVVCEVDRLNKI